MAALELDDLEAKLAAAETQTAALQDEYDSASVAAAEAKSTAETRITELEAEIAALKARVSELEELNAGLSKLPELEAEVERLQALNEALEKDDEEAGRAAVDVAKTPLRHGKRAAGSANDVHTFICIQGDIVGEVVTRISQIGVVEELCTIAIQLRDKGIALCWASPVIQLCLVWRWRFTVLVRASEHIL